MELGSMDHFGKVETLVGDHMTQVSAGSMDSNAHQSVRSLELVTQYHGESQSVESVVATLVHFHGST